MEHLQSSLQQGVVKYSAALLAQGRKGDVNKVISSSCVYSTILAVVACAGALVVAAFYSDPSGKIGFGLIVGGIMALFVFPLTPYIAVIQSRQRYYVRAIAETVSKYISLGVIFVWFKWVSPSCEALFIIMAITLFLSRLAQVPVAYRLVPGLQNHPSLFDKRHFSNACIFWSNYGFDFPLSYCKFNRDQLNDECVDFKQLCCPSRDYAYAENTFISDNWSNNYYSYAGNECLRGNRQPADAPGTHDSRHALNNDFSAGCSFHSYYSGQGYICVVGWG